MIKIEALSKKYKVQDIEIVALSDINLDIRKGEVLGIIGPSNAGKSTLLRMMSGQEMPTSGKIWWKKKGKDEEVSYHTQAKNKKVAVLFQDLPILWSKTVEQNLSFFYEIQGLQKQSIRRKVRAMLKLVQLDTMGNCYLAQLNGLQKQKLALACALTYEPEVLLCDVTRLRLDPALKDALFGLIQDLQSSRNFALVFFTYDMQFIKQCCTHIVRLQDGKIIEQGLVSEVVVSSKKERTVEMI